MLAEKTIREFAEDIIGNHGFENMEAILYTDGEHTIRQSRSFGTDEDEIMVTIPLGQAYWGDSYIWGEDLEKDIELVETTIDDLVEDIYSKIWIWEAEEEEEREKMKAYFEEEREQMENMFGF